MSVMKSAYISLLMWSDLTLGPLIQDQMKVVQFESAYNSLIIDPRGLLRETNL